jgi:hypothetical protein
VSENVVSTNPRIQAKYEELRAKGQSHAMAELLAFRLPPGTKGSDKAFMQGRNNGEWLNDYQPIERRRLLEKARKAGINPNGKVYMNSLARSSSDDRAWVSDVGEAMKLRQIRVDELKRSEEAPPVRLAEDMVQAKVAEAVAVNPMADRRELREMIIEKHGAPAC